MLLRRLSFAATSVSAEGDVLCDVDGFGEAGVPELVKPAGAASEEWRGERAEDG